MSNDTYINQFPHLETLEYLSSVYYLEKQLEKYWFGLLLNDPSRLIEILSSYKEKIQQYYNSDLLKRNKNKPDDVEKLAKPIPISLNFEFRKIAEKASCYFKQGLDMYISSVKTNISSNPLIEYYSFLQCIKGTALLFLEISNPKLLFGKHGLQYHRGSNKGKYPGAEVKAYGVFHTLLLYHDTNNEMDFYFKKKKFSLDEILYRKNFPSAGHTVASAFILSFILSSLVRYQPRIWQKIYLSTEDDIILKIQNFRRKELPRIINYLFPFFIR